MHYGQPTFTVSYYVAHDFVEEIKPRIEELFVWREEIGSCSKTCGSGGVKVVKSACFEKKTNLKVTSEHCKEAAPRWRTEQCQLEDCPAQAKWAASEWGVCSANCGHGTATRVLSCVREIRGGGAFVHNPRSQSPFTIVNGVHKMSKINTSFMLRFEL